MPDVKISPASIVIALATILVLGTFGWLTFSPKNAPPPPPALTDEAKAYLDNLSLSDVHMQAAESYVQQRLVEILGSITNKGNRPVKSVEVTCVFHDYNGMENMRQRVAIVGGRMGSLSPGQSKPFRLAFDNLPENWNQGMPNLVIAAIQFE